MDLSARVDRWARREPTRVALRFGDQLTTYGALAEQIDQRARVLAGQFGVGHAMRVAVAAPNQPDTLITLFACARLGAIMVPLNIRLSGIELAHCINDSGATLVIATDELAALLPHHEMSDGQVVVAPDDALWRSAQPEVAAVGNDDDHVLIIYTSGTTGKPKGAVLSQRALNANTVNSMHFHDMTASDVVLTAAPLFHVGGLNIQTMPALMSGASVIVHPRFDSGAWLRDVVELRPTLSVLVPAMMKAVIEHPGWASTDLSSLRSITTGSSMVPHGLIHAFHERGVPVCQVYGLTETSPIAVHQRPSDALVRVGSTGQEAALTEIRIVDAEGDDVVDGNCGEVLLRGANLFDGYWNNPEATAAAVDSDGWFRSGDIGRRDEYGDLIIVDRSKDMIISGGENVYPAEIEQVLSGCPGVAEVAVIGAPDERWGEIAVAVVVRAEGAANLDDAFVLAYAHDRLARFKQPRRFVFVDSLPRNVMGKVLKHELRDAMA
jgi:fatty-acyl-CoA synthase